MSSYFAIGRWNLLFVTFMGFLSAAATSDPFDSFTSKRLEDIKGGFREISPNNQPNDEAAWCQQHSFNVRRTSPSRRWRLKSYVRNCRRSTTRGQDRLSTQMPNWAAPFRDGTRCCCPGRSYKRVTLRLDSLTLWLIPFSLLQPSPASRLFWLFPLHLFLIDWTVQSYTSGYFLWADFEAAIKNFPIPMLEMIRRRKSKICLGPLDTSWVAVKTP